MKDWQMGYLPATDDALLGNAYSDNEITDFGLGAPQRVLDEWEKRHNDRVEAERARKQLLCSRKVDTRCMTEGDAARIMPKAKPLTLARQGEPLTAAKLEELMQKVFLAHAQTREEEYQKREREAAPMPIWAAAHPQLVDRWKRIGQEGIVPAPTPLQEYVIRGQEQRQLAFDDYAQAQAQQNQAVQNAYTDSLLQPSVQLSQWSPR